MKPHACNGLLAVILSVLTLPAGAQVDVEFPSPPPPAPRVLAAEDGYNLWLRYKPVEDQLLLLHYRAWISEIVVQGDSPTFDAIRSELQRGLNGLLDTTLAMPNEPVNNYSLLVGTPSSSGVIAFMANLFPGFARALAEAGEDGFVIRMVKADRTVATVIAANSDVGALYGAFHLLRMVQTRQYIDNLAITSTPRVQLRVLNHWDNLDRTVERGYAGFSLWDWHKLPANIKGGDNIPGFLDPRYTDYARANASIGINGAVLTNVNANALVLTPPYLAKAAALADVFGPYGIRVFLTARFSAPMEIGGLATSDPLDANVQQWWKQTAREIYRYIPDFGGFLVKANSEGQPGPQDYDRSHADGANMLADAVAPFGGVVMWRAFVYSAEEPEDRAKQAFTEFKPLDGSFRDNVLIQVKNGPIDFQPREPFHPLFGAMPKTPLMMEFQITQEYLGQATHLAYLAPLFKEVLAAETYAAVDTQAEASVARVIDGTLHGYRRTGIAGVSNIGTDRNWCGSVMACANWYAFGRLAWDHSASSENIVDEWIRMTFSNDSAFVNPVKDMMMGSREAVVDYMTPMGLHHLMGRGHHYGPGPWVSGGPRADWTSVYYHRADADGVGFDRTVSGSDAVSQYNPPLDGEFGNIDRVPPEFLLWFHHVGWKHKMKSGRTLWEELVRRYYRGAESVRGMQRTWESVRELVDEQRYEQVRAYLAIQEQEARWWRDASVLYFQTFSRLPLPDGLEKPEHTAEYYQALSFPFAPGN